MKYIIPILAKKIWGFKREIACFLLLCSLAGNAFSEDPLTTVSSREGLRDPASVELANYITDSTILWLNDGRREFLSIYREPAQKKIKGAVLILPDVYANVNWTNVIAPLRQYLSEQGWTSLSIELPNPNTVKQQLDTYAIPPHYLEQASQQTNDGESDQQTLWLTLQYIVNTRIDEALKWLHQKGYTKIMVFAQGSSGLLAGSYFLKYPNDTAPIKVKALVVLSTYVPSSIEEFKKAHQSMVQLSLPTLDIFGSSDYPQILQAGEERRQLKKQAGNILFQQKEIEGANFSQNTNIPFLFGQMNNWIQDTHLNQLLQTREEDKAKANQEEIQCVKAWTYDEKDNTIKETTIEEKVPKTNSPDEAQTQEKSEPTAPAAPPPPPDTYANNIHVENAMPFYFFYQSFIQSQPTNILLTPSTDSNILWPNVNYRWGFNPSDTDYVPAPILQNH